MSTISYYHEGTELKGFLAYDEKKNLKVPAILIAHAWKGQDQFVRDKAKAIAELGYVGFALDIYGGGKSVETTNEASALMQPFYADRSLLQGRMKAAYSLVQSLPMVHPQKIGGIGFCFGGLAIIELFRSGVDMRGACSFHAVLGNEGAKTVPIAEGIAGSLLMLHGADDPLVSKGDIEAIQKELTLAKIDWEMDIYGHTTHAFSVPGANDKSLGLLYSPKAERRSWRAMKSFFEELFS